MAWWFEKKTVGSQFVRAIDSISANVAEGFGRYHKKDKIKFYRYSQGSLKETLDWNEKAKKRKLLKSNEYQHILTELQKIDPALGRLIKYTNTKLKFWGWYDGLTVWLFDGQRLVSQPSNHQTISEAQPSTICN